MSIKNHIKLSAFSNLFSLCINLFCHRRPSLPCCLLTSDLKSELIMQSYVKMSCCVSQKPHDQANEAGEEDMTILNVS